MANALFFCETRIKSTTLGLHGKLRPSYHLYPKYLAPTVKRIISFNYWQRSVVEDHKYSIYWLTTTGNINAYVITVQVCSCAPEDSCLSGGALGCCRGEHWLCVWYPYLSSLWERNKYYQSHRTLQWGGTHSIMVEIALKKPPWAFEKAAL